MKLSIKMVKYLSDIIYNSKVDRRNGPVVMIGDVRHGRYDSIKIENDKTSGLTVSFRWRGVEIGTEWADGVQFEGDGSLTLEKIYGTVELIIDNYIGT